MRQELVSCPHLGSDVQILLIVDVELVPGSNNKSNLVNEAGAYALVGSLPL